MQKDIYTTNEIDQLLSVDISTVAEWIDRGKLPAYRTPGGHRRVHKKDLLSFLHDYKMPVPVMIQREKRVILVVEDDRDFRSLVRRTLDRPDVEIHEAEDGYAA